VAPPDARTAAGEEDRIKTGFHAYHPALQPLGCKAGALCRMRIMAKLKSDIQFINKKGLYYLVDSGNSVIRFKPWLGDSFSFLYDYFMSNSVFPKKFGADIQKHDEILSQELAGTHGRRVLELATGNGSAVRFLNNDNQYTGTDISTGLLEQATKRFRKAGFPEPEFYVVSVDDLPFENDIFDLCLCILSLNFFNNVQRVFQEIKRVLVPEGVLLCCVPVPERNRHRSTIRGTLYSEAEIEKICQQHHFKYKCIPSENGALLYFKAINQG
jgi:ubiquinone/menaquinone biosynthesis C-methylase UbiE